MTQARQAINMKFKAFAASAHDRKTASYQLLKPLLDKLGGDHEEVSALELQPKLDEFKIQFLALKEKVGITKSWNKATFKGHYVDCLKGLEVLQKFDFTFSTSLEALKKVRLMQVQCKAGDRRKLSLQIRRLVKGLAESGFFPNLVTWFGEGPLGIQSDSEVIKPTSILTNVPAEGGLWVKPCVLKENDVSPLAKAMKIRAGDLSVEVKSIVEKLDKNLTKFKLATNVGRVTEAPPAEDQVPWSMSCFKKIDGEFLEPDGIRKHGVAWALGSKAMSFRHGRAQCPYEGFGALVRCVQGDAVMCMVPIDKVVAAGGSADNFKGFIENMATGDAATFMTMNSVTLYMSEFDCAWVPYGWFHFIVTTKPVSFLLWQPVLNLELLADVPDNISEKIGVMNLSFMQQHKANALFKDIVGPFGRWLSKD